MKKTLLLLFAGFIGFFQMANATGPLRNMFSVKQGDGSVLQLQKAGNANFKFFLTNDGKALLRSADGEYQYAIKTADGLALSGICAHDLEMRSLLETQFLKQNGMDADEAYLWMSSLYSSDSRPVRTLVNGDGILSKGERAGGVVSNIGNPVIPVIMIDFSDRKFLPETTMEKVNRMLNEHGYADEPYCKGSVKDYFTSQSNGLFSPSFEVVAKVSASQPYAYYGKNRSQSSRDQNVIGLIREALDSASVAGVDFKKYATDNNRVPLVSVYFAGPGEHSSFEIGCDDYIWAHFSRRSFVVDGVGINSYFVGNEVLQKYRYDDTIGAPVPVQSNFDGIGIFVHEFGHALGLPDFYQTIKSGNVVTPDFWSVMDYGQYMFEGYAPIGYSAFERASLGWIDVKDLTKAEYVKLYPFGMEEKGNTACRIVNDENEKEYFMLENRRAGNWYPTLMGEGLLITHVNYDAGKWNGNRVNNDPSNQGYQVVPADNIKSGYNEKGRPEWNFFKSDLFPGLTGNKEFSDVSVPSADVYSGGHLGKPLYNISDDGGVISFSFIDKELTGVENVINNGFKCGATFIYTLAGQLIEASSQLAPGVYLVKSGDKIKKIYIK